MTAVAWIPFGRVVLYISGLNATSSASRRRNERAVPSAYTQFETLWRNKDTAQKEKTA